MDAKDLLRELYASKWEQLSSAMKPIVEGNNYSIKPTNPLLLWPCLGDDEYDKADIRVMILGQETNDWYGTFNPYADKNAEIERLFEFYNEFYNVDQSYRSQFWNGFNLFKNLLNKKFPNKNIRYAWNNVIKIGKDSQKGLPPDYIYNIEQSYFRILEDEINILKPHIMLFLTGPNYDNYIKDKLGEVYFKQISPFTSREIAELNINDVNFAFRTYHPNYLYRQGKGVINQFFQTIIDKIEKIE